MRVTVRCTIDFIFSTQFIKSEATSTTHQFWCKLFLQRLTAWNCTLQNHCLHREQKMYWLLLKEARHTAKHLLQASSTLSMLFNFNEQPAATTPSRWPALSALPNMSASYFMCLMFGKCWSHTFGLSFKSIFCIFFIALEGYIQETYFWLRGPFPCPCNLQWPALLSSKTTNSSRATVCAPLGHELQAINHLILLIPCSQ